MAYIFPQRQVAGHFPHPTRSGPTRNISPVPASDLSPLPGQGKDSSRRAVVAPILIPQGGPTLPIIQDVRSPDYANATDRFTQGSPPTVNDPADRANRQTHYPYAAKVATTAVATDTTIRVQLLLDNSYVTAKLLFPRDQGITAYDPTVMIPKLDATREITVYMEADGQWIAAVNFLTKTEIFNLVACE
jgi:hypothetical protein